MNIRQALQKSTKKLKLQNIYSANLDAEVLLLEALNKNTRKLNCNDVDIKCRIVSAGNDSRNLDKSWLYAHNDYELNKDEEKLFNDFVNQRKKHKPVAYIINQKEFYGYNFYVNKNVLIPRPETELLVEEALKIINNQKNKQNNLDFTLIDIGTGSGCIIISIINQLIEIQKDKVIHSFIANDISPKAIEIAKINAQKYNLDKKIKFITGNFKKAINKKTFSTSSHIIITANLPYIKNEDYKKLSEDVKKYEPETALKGGKQGLDSIEKLIDNISELEPEKKIFVIIETDPSQINRIKARSSKILPEANVRIIKDLSQKNRVVLIDINVTNQKS
jgi:release factor glutamine methyltransferase